MARPPKKPEVTGPIDMSLFSEDELKRLEAEAQKEFDFESKTEAEDAFKAATKEKLRKKALFKAGKDAEGDEVELIQIDLAPHSSNITIDGHIYYHGLSYKFTQAQAATIKDIMSQSWRHEDEVRGVDGSADYGRRKLNRTISPRAA
jgi:hypothetical protein